MTKHNTEHTRHVSPQCDWQDTTSIKPIDAVCDNFILAAPDMYEALKLCIEIIEALDAPSDPLVENYEDIAVISAHAAIAKAEGK